MHKDTGLVKLSCPDCPFTRTKCTMGTYMCGHRIGKAGKVCVNPRQIRRAVEVEVSKPKVSVGKTYAVGGGEIVLIEEFIDLTVEVLGSQVIITPCTHVNRQQYK